MVEKLAISDKYLIIVLNYRPIFLSLVAKAFQWKEMISRKYHRDSRLSQAEIIVIMIIRSNHNSKSPTKMPFGIMSDSYPCVYEYYPTFNNIVRMSRLP